ncbi:MAG: DUF2079 domain-containing protein [Elusimicrobia bacterium]|nr:DUF2079 domain-containing protein [Elusimicrobiota bacterium]
MRKSNPDAAYAWSGALLFAVVVGDLKWLQAVRLQNQAFDLGIYANVLWNTAHGDLFRDSIKGVNYLGDHFSPGMALLAPLLRLWPDAIVLSLAQSAALAMGIPAVHRLAWEKTHDRAAAAGFALLYALSPLVHEASRYDVHAVTFAVPLLLWGLVLAGRPGLGALFLAGTLQEDLWLCAAAAAWHRREKRAAIFFIGSFVLSLILLRSIGGIFIPAHWSFYDPALIGASLLTPTRIFGLARLLLPLGGLPLLGGAAAWPLLVPLGYTFLGANPHQGLLDLQYGAPLIAFAFLAAIHGWTRLKRRPWWAFAVMAFASVVWLKPYSRPLPEAKASAARELLALVPADAPVSASFNLAPRLAARPDVRMWIPGQEPAGWWLALDASPFAFGPAALQSAVAVEALADAHPDRVVFRKEGFVLLRPAEPFGKMPP